MIDNQTLPKMKNYLFLLASLLLFFYSAAQVSETSGIVKYEKVVKVEITLQGDAARFQDMVPRERKAIKELLFTEDASLFRNAPRNNDEAAMDDQGPGMRMRFRMMDPEDIAYHDISINKAIEQRDFMTRKFLIEADLDTLKWRLTGKQKMMLDFPCVEAELVGSAKKTIAWFTPAIPVSTGPDAFGNLPGLILALDIDEGRTTVTATGIELKNIDAREILKPREGKKVTRKEYDAMVQEKIKEMQESGGGGGQIRIRHF